MKLCLSLGGKTLKEVHRKWNEWASKVDLVEIRLDTLSFIDLSDLLSSKPGCVIITNRRKEEGGFYEGQEEDRISLLMEAAEKGADLIDIEMSTPQPLLNQVFTGIDRGKTQIILSFHDIHRTRSLSRLKALFRQMKAWNPDVIKIVTTAQSYEDSFSTLSLIPYARKEGQNIIAFSMGYFGKPSRVAAYFLGSYITYLAPKKGSETASGQLSYKEFVMIRRLLLR